MSEHTPGPWTWREDDGTLRDKHRNAIINPTLLTAGRELRDCVNKDADARLIAAAPDLLAALEQIEEWDREDGHDGTHPFACAACQRVDLIAKAKGEA